jgi:predicted SAM-dependent methyltransferase
MLNLSLNDCFVYVKQNLNKAKAPKIIDNYLKSCKQPKLQIGCGHKLAEGWLNTDLTPLYPGVAFLDASKKFPFKDNSFDFIFSEHTFEHLKFRDSCNMISECYRVLKPNGVLRLAMPHADFLFKLYQDPELSIHKDYTHWAINKFCGDVVHLLSNNYHPEVYVINNFYRDWGHQMIHKYDSLEKLLQKFNFSNIKRKEVGVSDFEELSNMEKHGEVTSNEFNKLETLVIEAKK